MGDTSWQTSSVKSQIVKVVESWSHVISVATTQLYFQYNSYRQYITSNHELCFNKMFFSKTDQPDFIHRLSFFDLWVLESTTHIYLVLIVTDILYKLSLPFFTPGDEDINIPIFQKRNQNWAYNPGIQCLEGGAK